MEKYSFIFSQFVFDNIELKNQIEGKVGKKSAKHCSDQDLERFLANEGNCTEE